MDVGRPANRVIVDDDRLAGVSMASRSRRRPVPLVTCTLKR
jgi:hypothetical protein